MCPILMSLDAGDDFTQEDVQVRSQHFELTRAFCAGIGG